MEQNTPTPSSQKLAAALAAAQPTVPLGGANGGHSVAEMAQQDLDAALQLLADRAQYITGASGAAIALRRDGRNDMLCRASAGSNAPELGALLSTEFGLSGESVRTRQLLRCDDAERDARVNREVCRQLGIASVLVMPVVNDDQVLGVFELFSGKANAFGERDLSAVQRLSEMVETAVRLAHATEKLPEQLKEQEKAAEAELLEGQFVTDLVVEEPEASAASVRLADKTDVLVSAARAASNELTKLDVNPAPIAAASNVTPAPLASVQSAPAAPVLSQSAQTPTLPSASSPSASEPAPSVPLATPKKTLFWSAALDADAEAENPAEADQAYVPPVLRGLHKCVACGFPVSAGRMLCVECEEKKWRGQLRSSQVASRTAAKPAAPLRVPAPAESPNPAVQAFAAAAPSMAKTPAVGPAPASLAPDVKPSAPPAQTSADQLKKQDKQPASTVALSVPVPEAPSEPAAQAAQKVPRDFVLSAGLGPSQSWLSRNKYVVGVLLAVAAAAVAFFFLH